MSTPRSGPPYLHTLRKKGFFWGSPGTYGVTFLKTAVQSSRNFKGSTKGNRLKCVPWFMKIVMCHEGSLILLHSFVDVFNMSLLLCCHGNDSILSFMSVSGILWVNSAFLSPVKDAYGSGFTVTACNLLLPTPSLDWTLLLSEGLLKAVKCFRHYWLLISSLLNSV